MARPKSARANALLALMALCALLTGCAEQRPSAAPACAEVVDAVLASQAFEEMTPLSQERLTSFLGIDSELLAGQAMAVDISRATAECVVALTATDAEALKALEKALSDFRADTLEQYRDYQPSEAPKLEDAVLRTNGLQTVLIICSSPPDAQRALDGIWK